MKTHRGSLVKSRWKSLGTSLVGLSCALLACSESEPQTQDAAPSLPDPIEGFSTPESVLHDVERDVYLVANINGSPVDKDDNGFISRVSPDGEILELRWIDGASEEVTLNAPKGMAITGGKLYVADIDAVRVFDAADGTPIQSIEVPGATFLNDVAAIPDGSIVVSDTGFGLVDGALGPTGADALLVIDPAGEVTKLISGDAIPHPNGVTWADDAIWVALYEGRLQSYDLSGALKQDIAVDFDALPAGELDGLVRRDDGSFLVSSWSANAVFVINLSTEGAPSIFPIAVDLPAPADIGWDGKRNRLLVPLFNDNKLELVKLL